MTTQFLDYAKGKTTLSRQEIMDFAKRPELKKGEADLLLKKLEEFEPNIPKEAINLVNKVRSQSEDILRETIEEVEDMVPKGIKITNIKIAGSSIKGKFVSGQSDVDLVVTFNKKLSNDEYNWLIPSLNDTLESRFGSVVKNGIKRPKIEIIAESDVGVKSFQRVIAEAKDIPSDKFSVQEFADSIRRAEMGFVEGDWSKLQ